MKSLKDIKKIVTQFNVKPGSEMRSKVLDEALDIQRSQNQQNISDTYIWRIIMKSKITKFAAAGVIFAVAILSITFLDKAVTPAYAIEQTIEAMRSISSIHAYSTDWDNSQGETWVQINPETGQEEYQYSDQGNLLIVATPKVTYFYHKDKNLVRVQKEYVPASSVSIANFFEELSKWVQGHGGKYEFHSQFDEKLQKEIIMVHVVLPVMEKELYVRIDPQTKLPINLESISSKPGQGVKSVDSIEYNIPIPEGIFEFKIPEGTKVIHQ
ncbi:MAG: hypothetical protein H8D47_01390 [Planctomycetes bacterium]|nr:hypothetical protein [Planctomycetota bacterium]